MLAKAARNNARRGGRAWHMSAVRPRAELSGASDPGHRHDQRRRHRRSVHARTRRGAAQAPRPAGGNRGESPGRRQQSRRTRACADAAPDGYTICITQTEPIVYNQFLYKNLGFNP